MSDMKLETALAVAERNWAKVVEDGGDEGLTHQEMLERALEVLAAHIRGLDECDPAGIARPSTGAIAAVMFEGYTPAAVFVDEPGYTHTLRDGDPDAPWLTVMDVGDDEESNVIPFRRPGQREPGWR